MNRSLCTIFLWILSIGPSCGKSYAMTLDVNSTVWIFLNWGRPSRIVSPFLDCSSSKTTPVQVECGFRIFNILMESGDVYTWWLPMYLTSEFTAGLDYDESKRAIVPDGGTVIPCYTLEINRNFRKLPKLPDLPDLPGTGLPEEERQKETKLVKIVAPGQGLVGLTNKGHVLKSNPLTYGEDYTPHWYYVGESAQSIIYLYSNDDTQLPNYSEIDKVKEHPAFHISVGNDGQERPPEVELSSDVMLITDVSYIVSMNSGFPILDLSMFRFLHAATTSLPAHPSWCSRGDMMLTRRCFQPSSQSFRTDLSSPLSGATTTLVLSPPPESS